MQIGKSGLTDNVIEHIKKHVKKRKLIKIKLLKSYMEGKDKKKVFQDIATKADAVLVGSIGFVIVLAKKEVHIKNA